MASPRLDGPSEMTFASVPAGFAELYERHYEAVYRAALRVTRVSIPVSTTRGADRSRR